MSFCFKGASLSAATARKDLAAAFLNYLGLLIFFLPSNCAWLWQSPTKFFPLPQQLKCGGHFGDSCQLAISQVVFIILGSYQVHLCPQSAQSPQSVPPPLVADLALVLLHFFITIEELMIILTRARSCGVWTHDLSWLIKENSCNTSTLQSYQTQSNLLKLEGAGDEPTTSRKEAIQVDRWAVTTTLNKKNLEILMGELR